MNIVSFRNIFSSKDFNDKLKSLRRRRYFTEENIKTSKGRLKLAKSEEEYDAISDHIKILELDAAEIADQIDDLEGSTSWRAEQIEEIKNYGFSISSHAVIQYNERFEPQLNREQLMSLLKQLGLGKKIDGNTHQLIQLKQNFRVAIEHGVVTTFKYDDNYYHGPQTPKFDLGVS